MKSIHHSLLLGAALTLAVAACKKDDDLPDVPPPTNAAELITTAQLHFVDDADSTQQFTAVFRDTDGEGGNAPSRFDTLRLTAGKVYQMDITLLDESKSPAVDISAEVDEEKADHLFCFTPSGVGVTVQRTDTDGTYEVGLESRWTVGSTPGTGTVTVTLKHQPGVKDGSCAPGDTDIELTFVTLIQ